MKHLQTGTVLAATLTSGLMAGLFAAFAYSVMPGLGRSSDRTFVEAMQNINKAILNPVFMLLFMGTVPLIGLAVVLAWRGHGRAALPWLIAALGCYLAAFAVTSGINVPLNDALAQAHGPHHLATARDDFESAWVAWNIVRTVLHLAAFACTAIALLALGTEGAQDADRSDGATVGATTTAHPPAR